MAILPVDKPELSHYAYGYDPAKAHDYYMRTRHLHPRQKGQAQPPKAGGPDVARERAQIAASITSLTRKLSELQSVLARKKAALARDKKLNPAQKKRNKAAASKKYRQQHQQQLKNKAKQRASKAKASGGGGGSKGSATSKGVISNPKSGSIKEVEAAIKIVQDALNSAKARQRALG